MCKITNSNSLSSFHMINSIYNIWLVQNFKIKDKNKHTHKSQVLLTGKCFVRGFQVERNYEWNEKSLKKLKSCFSKKPLVYVYIFQTKYDFAMQQTINHEHSFELFCLSIKGYFLWKVFDMKIYSKEFYFFSLSLSLSFS